MRSHSPSISRDGRWLAYATTNEGNNETVIRLKDLATGSDRLVTDRAHPYGSDMVSISPDGSHVVFCRLDVTSDGHTMQNAYIVPSEGGTPERLCGNCDPRGFSSDGSLVLMQQIVDNGLDYIAAVDLASKTAQKFLSHAQWQLYHSFFSWDDKWVVFKRMIDLKHGQLLIAPVKHGLAGDEAEWIAATDGRQDDDKPQFSPNGNTLYFTSDRDGFRCVWALRLNHASKRPEGGPVAIQHLHNFTGLYSLANNPWGVVLSVARDKLVMNLAEPHGDIWLKQVE
jgi:Tol biopolymer transport system component